MDFIRQWKMVDLSKIKAVGIIGAGSIGSWTALSLAKMGVEDITVWDFDTIEEHNGPNQMYKVEDDGRPKVEALFDIIKEFAGTEIHCECSKYDGTKKPLMICGVDDIEVRRDIFEDYIDNKYGIDRYWDARMGGEMATIISINPKSMTDSKRYKESLFTREETHELPCGERSVVYNNEWIGSFIANQVKSFAMKDDIFTHVDFSWKPYEFSGSTLAGEFMFTKRRGK